MTHLNLSEHQVDLSLRLKDFILPDRTSDFPKLKILLPEYLISLIKGIPLPLNPMPDEPIWGPSSSGLFTVKTANWLSHKLPTPAEKWPHRWIWQLDIPPKLKLFMWQICHNSLGVRGILAHRNIVPFSTCAICTDHTESLDHLFGGCPSLRPLWQLPALKDWLPHSLPLATLHLSLSKIRSDKLSTIKLVFLLWSIWKERNAIIFHNDSLNNYRILHRAKFLFSEWTLRTAMDLCDSAGSLSPPPPSAQTTTLLRCIPLPSSSPGSRLPPPSSNLTLMVRFVEHQPQQVLLSEMLVATSLLPLLSTSARPQFSSPRLLLYNKVFV